MRSGADDRAGERRRHARHQRSGLRSGARVRGGGLEVIAIPGPVRCGGGAVDRRAADGPVLLRGIFAGAPRRAPRTPARARGGAAHAGALRIAAPRAGDSRGLRGELRRRRAPPRSHARSPSFTRRSIAARSRELAARPRRGRRFRARRNRAGDRRRSRARAPPRARTVMAARSTACSSPLLAELPLKQAAQLAAQIAAGARQRGLQGRCS